jgi:hypothetical protein
MINSRVPTPIIVFGGSILGGTIPIAVAPYALIGTVAVFMSSFIRFNEFSLHFT